MILPWSSSSSLLLFLVVTLPSAVAALGLEKAAYPHPSYPGVLAWRNKLRQRENDIGNDNNNSTTSIHNDDDFLDSYRQDICERYDRYTRGEIPLRDALQGLQLRPLMRVNKFFRYTDEEGIDALDPGLMAVMMDELARRAGFTWRESFGVVHQLPSYQDYLNELDQNTGDSNNTALLPNEALSFTDLLLWSLETYDLSVNWWDRTLERLEGGASFMHPWFDGSIIMVGKVGVQQVDEKSVDFWNWLRPFDRGVWLMTAASIIWSALAYQWIESLSGHRRGRTWGQWFIDNLYLSAINFPQNYEFEPRSFAGRLFGVSISLWALLMTATYTANLASLLVDTKVPLLGAVDSMDDAVTLGMSLCVYENTGADDFIKQKYRQAKRVPFPSELESFQGLNELQCDITIAYYQNWLGFQTQQAYNPVCDLEWVGRTVKTLQSGFANKVDTGNKCTSLIGSVLDVYLNELELSGFIEDMWEEHYAKTQDINCDALSPEALAAQQAENGRRLAEPQSWHSPSWTVDSKHFQQQRRRELKGAAKGAAAGGAAAASGGPIETDADATKMTLNQMAGTFALHFWLSACAIFIGYVTKYYKENHKGKINQVLEMTSSYFWVQFKGDGRNDNTNTGSNNTDECERHEDETEELPKDESHLSKRERRKQHHDLEHQHFNDDDDDHQIKEELKETKQELLETRQELRDTRREMHEQMDKILNLLSTRPGDEMTIDFRATARDAMN